jgi:hypothetical protein
VPKNAIDIGETGKEVNAVYRFSDNAGVYYILPAFLLALCAFVSLQTKYFLVLHPATETNLQAISLYKQQSSMTKLCLGFSLAVSYGVPLQV